MYEKKFILIIKGFFLLDSKSIQIRRKFSFFILVKVTTFIKNIIFYISNDLNFVYYFVQVIMVNCRCQRCLLLFVYCFPISKVLKNLCIKIMYKIEKNQSPNLATCFQCLREKNRSSYLVTIFLVFQRKEQKMRKEITLRLTKTFAVEMTSMKENNMQLQLKVVEMTSMRENNMQLQLEVNVNIENPKDNGV